MSTFLVKTSLFILLTLAKKCALKDGSEIDCPEFNDETKVKMFTDDELAEYDGIKNKKVYLAVIGEVFDVTKGHKYYGPGESEYSGFAAKDGSRAFAVGGFTEKELIPDITDLEPSQVIAIYDWMTFYRKDYIPVGKLIGFYYDENGQPTDNRRKVEELLMEGYQDQKNRKDMGDRYPRCNSQRGTKVRNRVWCADKSGGVARDWVGVPRKFRDPTLGGGKVRCACVPPHEADDPRFKQYDEYPCADDSFECFLEPPLKDDL